MVLSGWICIYGGCVEAFMMGDSIACCGLWMFTTSWLVIGFLLYYEIDDGVNECKNMVLIWCIIQIMENIFNPWFAWSIIFVISGAFAGFS